VDLRLLVAISALGCAAPSVDVATSAIVGGSADADDPSVGALVTWEPACAQPPTVICTAFLVAPRVAITAGHCVDDLRGGASAVFFGSDVAGAGTYVDVARAIAHPGFDPTTREYDVGLLVLAQAASVAPIAIETATIDDVAIGSTIRAIGFGITSADDLAYATAGVRRTGTLALRTIGTLDFEAGASPSMTCRIDSGGPVLAMIGGREVLVGITAGGDAACVDRARNMRVDAVLADFLQPALDAVAASPERPLADAARLAALCTDECANDDGCPLAMTCETTPTGHYCVEPRSTPGSYGFECGTDRECGMGTCVRLRATTCLCFAGCGMGPPPPPPPPADAGPRDAGAIVTAHGGCAADVPGSRGSWTPVLVMLGLLTARRRRSRDA
jgi:hypothetical protein